MFALFESHRSIARARTTCSCFVYEETSARISSYPPSETTCPRYIYNIIIILRERHNQNYADYKQFVYIFAALIASFELQSPSLVVRRAV